MAVIDVGKIDEVFDDEGDMREIDEIEWNKLKEARLKEGFAEGKYVGEESTLQNGFDHGYSEGFELSHSISIIQGLMAVVEMQIADSELLKRSRDIKIMLDNFKENIRNFKLKCLLGEKSFDNNDDMSDCCDENSNSFETKGSKSNYKECYFISLNTEDIFEKNREKIKFILEEFNKMREEITCFISDCNQPAIMDQISKSMYLRYVNLTLLYFFSHSFIILTIKLVSIDTFIF